MVSTLSMSPISWLSFFGTLFDIGFHPKKRQIDQLRVPQQIGDKDICLTQVSESGKIETSVVLSTDRNAGPHCPTLIDLCGSDTQEHIDASDRTGSRVSGLHV